MVTLRKAVKEGRLEDFVREREKDASGDSAKFDKALKHPARQKSSKARKALSRRESDD